MAIDKRKISLGININPDGSAEKQLDDLVKKLSSNKNIKLNIGDDFLNKLKSEFNELSNKKITIFSNENTSEVQKFTNSMNQLLTITNNFNAKTGKTNTTISFNDNIKKNQDEINKLNIEIDKTKSKIEELNNKSFAKNLNNEIKEISINAKDSNKSIDLINKTIDKLNAQKINMQNKFGSDLDVTQIDNMINKTKMLYGLDFNQTSNEINKINRAFNIFKTNISDISGMNKLNSEISKTESKIESLNNKSFAKNLNNEVKNITKEAKDFNKSIDLINKTIDKLNAQKINMQNKFGSNFDTSAIDNMINKAKSLYGLNFEQTSSGINKINSAFNLFKATAGDTKGIFESLNNSLRNVGIYFTLSEAVRLLTNQFKEASEYIKIVDKSMTNMQMITGKSKDEISTLANSYSDMAEQLHTTNKEMLSGMEEVTRAGYDSETGKKMMESAVMGAKISGQDTETVTQQLIAIKNAFNMSGDEIQRVVDIISRLDNVSATSFAEISEAIKRTAYSAQQAGTPFEKLSAYITTISEKTRKPAEEVGNSLRTIYARYSNIKLGNLDDEGKSINDTEKAMARVGIAIRDGQNKFRDFDAVLTEFMQKFKAGQISQVDYLSSIQALAGTR